MLRLLAITGLIVLMSGCATQRFQVHSSVAPQEGATLETTQPFFVGGIGQEQMINAAEVCGGAENVAAVETELSVLDTVLSALTGSIYSPRTAKVYCTL